MKPDGSVARQFGKRLRLPPLLGTRSRKEGAPIQPSKKVVSLSDFLDRKLGKNKTVVTGRSLREKKFSFSSACSINNSLGKRSAEVDESFAIDGAVFRQLNQTDKEHCCIGSSSGGHVAGESRSASGSDAHDLRKSKRPFVYSAGEDEGPTASKLLLVLGDDPKPKQKREPRFSDNKERPLFNHCMKPNSRWKWKWMVGLQPGGS